MAEVHRDTSNAIALGMCIGEMLMEADRQSSMPEGIEIPAEEAIVRPNAWRDIGWDQIVTDVDRAAEALDRYQVSPGVDWDDADWYLTLDRLACSIWHNPEREWTPDAIKVNIWLSSHCV